MATRGIEVLTSDILTKAGVINPPIDIKKVAKLSGVKVKIRDLGEGVSGFLAIQNGKALIGVNPDESLVRQRFSIAHELGHFYLHSKKGDVFFVSKQKKHSLGQREVHYRDEKSSSGEDKKEREANGFAAALLMPRSMVIKAIEITPPFFSTEEAIKYLAKTFNVSPIAMSIRLTRIGLITQLESSM